MINICYTLFAVGNKQYNIIIDARQSFCKMHQSEIKEGRMSEKEKEKNKI